MRPTTGTGRSASAKGRVISVNRAVPSSGGVRPPSAKILCPSSTVNPEARKLIATPEISWLPRKVIEASPWISDSTSDPAMPAASPAQALPVA